MNERQLRRSTRPTRATATKQQFSTPTKSPRQSPKLKSTRTSKFRRSECEMIVRGRKMNLDFPENVSMYRLLREWLYDVDSVELYEEPKFKTTKNETISDNANGAYIKPEYVVSSTNEFDSIVKNVNYNFDPKEELLKRFRKIRKDWVEHRAKFFVSTHKKIVNEMMKNVESVTYINQE